MATKLGGEVAAAAKHATEERVSLLTLSDEKILEQIYTTHVHGDDKFDVDSLFVVVENTLKHATHIVDNYVQGGGQSSTHGVLRDLLQGAQAIVEQQTDERAPKASFSPPLCTLKQIACELQCKPPGEDIAHKTTLAILNKLSNYSWEAKAVLTLAAFALDYGEFWFLAQSQSSDQLAKSLAVLRRVPVITKPAALQKHKKALIELNSLIRDTLEVIESIFELEKLTSYDPKDIPALAGIMDHVPVHVYRAIITVVSCATQVTCLVCDDGKTQVLSPYAQGLHYVLTKLKTQLMICKRQLEEAETHRRLRKFFQTPTEIMVVFQSLIFGKDDAQLLFDGSSRSMVKIDVLRRKNVLLFISTLDITDEEIQLLRPVHDELKKENQYKIVWVPIVDQWMDELRKKFEMVRGKMPWYAVQHFSPIAGVRYVKEEWHFKTKPIIVVVNPQGKVECSDATHMIRVWGMKAFPFTVAMEATLSGGRDWLAYIASDIHPSITTLIKEKKFIFFYGGTDSDWITQFTAKANALAADALIKEQKISIELVLVGKGGKGDHSTILTRFWDGIESMFLTKVIGKPDDVTREVQKLLSYRSESGWAVLSKGSAVVFSGHGTTVLKALDEFEKWKVFIKEKGFEVSLKEHHEKVVRTMHRCSRLDVRAAPGKVPEVVQCPDCPRKMEMIISYKCCHVDGAIIGLL
ncbi:protein SIEVE ELEMENT OCCLUSION B-like [Malania oleifera]|uniref:protein SIEVE ELEMENT OCCLUSION B-like n=1 Tax=Malania oleifera TaxID=397392 RepID=UPI0025ADD19E|nr:protein SIEVE ELEMENT OCCLUSION B-like [Malania oleifera]